MLWNVGDLRDTLGRRLQRTLREFVEAARISFHEFAVVETLIDDDIEPPQRQRAVAAGAKLEPEVSLPGFERPQRIDDDKFGACSTRLNHLRPEQRSRCGGAHAPQRDTFG